jgi:uncharacterized membrane protein
MNNILNKKTIFFTISTLALVALLVITFKMNVYPSSKQFNRVILNANTDIPVGEIIMNKQIEQTFMSTDDNLKGISLQFATYARINTGLLKVSVIDEYTSLSIGEWDIDTVNIADNSYIDFIFNNAIQNSKGKEYKIVINSDNSTPGNAVTLWSSLTDNYIDGELEIDGELQIGDLSLTLITNHYSFINTLYILYIILSLTFIIYLGWIIFGKRKKFEIEKLFVIMMLFFGTLYMLVLPPFSAPDEPRHYTTAYKNSNIIMFKNTVDENGKLLIREGDMGLYGNNPDINTYLNVYKNIFSISESNTIGIHPEIILEGSFWAHLPQSIGITVARLLNFGYTPLILCGRFFNLLFYTVLLYYAIKIIPFGKMILFSVSMLPMMLELASSLSYDPVTDSLAFFFIAYCMNLIYEKEIINKKDICILAVNIFLLAPCKVIYFFLVFLCILIPKTKFKYKKSYYYSNAIIVIIGMISMIISNINTLTNMAKSTSNVLPWIDQPSYTLKFFFNNPFKIIVIFINTLRTQFEFYFKSMLGGSLGWLEITVPTVIILGFFIVLLLSSLKLRYENLTININHKIIISFVCIVLSILVLLSMLFAWTPVTYSYIAGVQGRYFLPILPLFLILVRNSHIELNNSIDNYLIFILAFLNIITVSEVFVIISSRLI